ncbi:MAG: Hpt domain-containing protein [Halioglobus sp.]
MTTKTDIVSLKWVIGLMNKQAENAETSLIEFSKDTSQKKPLLQCMWAVHQITSTLRALGVKKGEMLTIEMERSLNALYKDSINGERRKLTMGGLMQALKVLPAYLAHVQNDRVDTGRGLEQYVNDLRRWVGERPRPAAFFFHMDVDETTGISPAGIPASDDEIKSRANVMLALYLEMAKSALRKRNVRESMKIVARISRKMQTLFAGTPPERFWMVQVGLCEGIAGGLIVPDECVAQVFKTGAFIIKYARENGSEVDTSIDYDSYLQQMLYYIASCQSKPVHIANIREVFGVTDNTIEESRRGLVHMDALVTALDGALGQLNGAADYITSNDLLKAAKDGQEPAESMALEGIERAQQRLSAAGQLAHVDSLESVYGKLKKLYSGAYSEDSQKAEKVASEIVRGIVDVKLDVEYKLEHGVCSSFSSREFELRESVVSATFTQMSMVENSLHEILRRKALAAALAEKPSGMDSAFRLTSALHRYLNKSDQGHTELRQAVQASDNGEGNIEELYSLALEFLNNLNGTPERQAIRDSLDLLSEIVGALGFAGMEREATLIEQCHNWLSAASKAGSVREDVAFRCFADVFAQIELHLQRSLIDPLDDTSHMLAFAEQQAEELGEWAQKLSSGADVVVPAELEKSNYVQDTDIPPEFREVFMEESEEIIGELSQLLSVWSLDPEPNEHLRDIRRHFHTFKGNGRAVGANVLGELGWAAQDMLDRVLDGDLAPTDNVQGAVEEVIRALPDLVSSYKNPETADLGSIRELTNKCFRIASSSENDLAEDLPQADGDRVTSMNPVSDAVISHPIGH